jgi:hypothetical protein
MLLATDRRCHNGFLVNVYGRPLWRWRINRCPTCGVYVLPYVVRYVDWRWWASRLRRG